MNISGNTPQVSEFQAVNVAVKANALFLAVEVQS